MSLKTSLPRLFVLALLLVSVGCETYPMGMSKQEWTSLSPQQQAEARNHQAAIDAENRRIEAQKEARQHELDLRRAEVEAAERARIDAELARQYSRARYGDIVTVTMREGMVSFNGKYATYEPVAFDLIRGQTRTVEFHRMDDPRTIARANMRLSEDGRTFYFDDGARKRLSYIDEGWDKGKTYTVRKTQTWNIDPWDAFLTIRYRPVGRGY